MQSSIVGDEAERVEDEYWASNPSDYKLVFGEDYASHPRTTLTSWNKHDDEFNYDLSGEYAFEKRTDEMQTKEQLQAKRDAALAEAEKYEEAIAARDKYGVKDPFKNGTVLKVEMRYSSSNVTYTYGVIKVASRYWLSGKVQQGIAELEGRRAGWTWENFVAWLAAGDATVWRAKELEQVL